MNKYIAEFIGTMILVFFGTGTAVVTGGFTGGLGLGYLGVVAIALAFGFDNRCRRIRNRSRIWLPRKPCGIHWCMAFWSYVC